MIKSARVRTALYADQPLLQGELDLLHTATLQRLYDLHQLGFVDRVFIDASHARLHHAVGVLNHIDKLVASVAKNLRSAPWRKFNVRVDGRRRVFTGAQIAEELEDNRPVIRLIGLLHDLTQAPFGHTIEDEIQLVGSRHDDPARQAESLYRLVCEYVGWLARDLGLSVNAPPGELSLPEPINSFLEAPDGPPPKPLAQVAEFAAEMLKLARRSAKRWRASWRLGPDEVLELLAQLNMAGTALLHLDLLCGEPDPRAWPDPTGYDFQRTIQQVLEAASSTRLLEKYRFEPHRHAYMLDLVGNTVCADLLDFAGRDSTAAGLKLGYDADRISENFTLVCWDAKYEIAKPPDGGQRAGADVGSAEPRSRHPFAGLCMRAAISLFSHKLRIDVPSELMNLLQVRFYVYERAIYHPTKCAAAAMLGTALQLLGWRTTGRRSAAPVRLPERLCHVGDAVFLHDLNQAARLALRELQTVQATGRFLLDKDLEGMKDLPSCVQVALALAILRRRIELGIPVNRSITEVRAALHLLERLRARRYPRPAFRALPNAHNTALEATARDLAEAFRQPTLRYKAERLIERLAALPLGSVVIYCPRWKPSEKVANVLVVLPDRGQEGEGGQAQEESSSGGGSTRSEPPRIARLREISRIDPEVFGEHEQAVKALENMYASMWRLIVYVSPEHLVNYRQVSDAAGRAVFHIMDRSRNFPGGRWLNDQHLEWELGKHFAQHVSQVPGRVRIDHPREGWIWLNLVTVDIGRAIEDLVREGEFEALKAYIDGATGHLYSPGGSPSVSKLKAILRAAASRPADVVVCRFSRKWRAGVFRKLVFPPFGRGFSRHGGLPIRCGLEGA